MSALVRIAIDRGGTFTDVHCSQPGKPDIVVKLLSVDPTNYPDAPTEGIRRALELSFGRSIPKSSKLKLDCVESIRMGTTVATNALLERKGARCALLTTKGFKDVLRIGAQARPNIFDLSVKKLSLLYETVVEIDERVTIPTSSEDPESPSSSDFNFNTSVVRGLTGDIVQIIRRPDSSRIKAQLKSLHDSGFSSIAIALLHSYIFPHHENLVADIARQMGFAVSVSSELLPMVKIVSRANSAIADAYLSPVTRRYIETFADGFEGSIAALSNKLLFMRSDGGLCSVKTFSGLRAVLSGPAGGVIGYAKTCYDPEDGTPLVSIDMGGTSTDVSRYSGHLEHVFETTTAQVTILSPSLDVSSIAAGGGSRLLQENGLFVVGPESAGAHPGPVCYRKGGPLAVTDANLLLGRLLPETFPKIFGPNEDEPLDIDATRAKFAELTETIAEIKGIKMSPEEVASGFLRVANEAMCRPIRSLTEAKGYESASHNLVVFGGAGGQHGAAIATALGISRILIPRFSSILSAYGMALADVVVEVQEPSSSVLDTRIEADNTASFSGLRMQSETLIQRAVDALVEQDFSMSDITTELSYNCRFQGTSTTIMVRKAEYEDKEFISSFMKQHEQLFGFTLQNRVIHVDDVRVRAIAHSDIPEQKSPYQELKELPKIEAEILKRCQRKKVYFDLAGWTDTVVVPLEEITPGEQIPAPAIIFDETQTILVEPGYIATATSKHIILDRAGSLPPKPPLDPKNVDPVQLSVFGHRFMGIAEQMGTILQQTAISTNIKERLDYSCALFSPNGYLVANAPHMPVHLGAMSAAVRFQVELLGDQIQDGDVLVSNHPDAGGSHLPDITVMTPAFHNGKIVFWTASRAHHADIGGIRAGSMPPFSKTIEQEGTQILSFKLVKEGLFDEEGITDLMYYQPAKYPGCSGTRTLSDNISDLKAQVSANHRGAVLIRALVNEFTLEVVQFYMLAIQKTAENAVRDLLRFVDRKFAGRPLHAVDYLDEGEELHLRITIDATEGDAVFDFTGTSPQSYCNLNAPTAIVYSAIIYVLRSLIPTSIPLNHGCLTPIQVVLPPHTLLSPGPGAATVGGNVETSQRITDLVLKALEVCGASQGTCNNLTFGYGGNSISGSSRKGFGYYETIAGGSGGGPHWDGQSGTHVHMSNTRMGDAEHVERRYPVIIHEFGIRAESGGSGRHPGGDGCVREVEFTRDLDVSILSERRVIPPYGMRGGQSGKCGRNWWLQKLDDGTYNKIYLGGKNEAPMKAGDRIRIETPGGGGYGAPGSSEGEDEQMYGTCPQFEPPVRASGSLAHSKEIAEGN
ncbi:Hydantoinase B/oxoprolinase-domain-containing protein [Lentinula aciculospora]|uniref:Hydantoinase B/oxoprolinase-domain-containing protein n=1 Tax=Lentinula aciculospora TaxID=153920 RepID=A0A9W9DXG4_9AGAR|nr:Hydantoinase B/oxoprolinase-domain-containing protein [Lentinula aciculospora]